MKLFKSTIKNTRKINMIIAFSSMIICFFSVVIARFIIYVVDGIVMNNVDIPNYLKLFFYDDTVLSKIIVAAVFMTLMSFVIAIFEYIRRKYSTKLKLQMQKNIKNLLLGHATYLDYHEYIGYESSQILQRVGNDSTNYIDYINSKYTLVLNTFFYTLFSLNVIIQLNYIVCIILSIIIVIIILMSIWYCVNTKKIVNQKVSLSEALIKKTMNAIYNAKIIKMTNNQNNEIQKFNEISETYLNCDVKEIDYLIYYELTTSQVKALSTPIIYLICGIMVINGHMQIGELMAIITFSTTILYYFRNIIFAVEGINDFLVPSKRMKEFLSLEEESLNDKNSKVNAIEKIEFKNVGIKFKHQTILENLNFTIHKGENIYLVGSNGSGKSILTKLLLGFIPYEGNISISDVELRDLHKSNLRENIGLCFQNPYIFSDTIRNNIDCFNNKDLKEIKNIVKICELSDEIETFTNQYDTSLGERGINLSGGQKQRINIARLLIQNKKVLIFDDILSKLDNTTKNKIVTNLNKYFPDNINIFITHDLLKIPKNSRILFIDNKTIIDSTNTKLEKSNKNYQKLIEICENSIGGLYE